MAKLNDLLVLGNSNMIGAVHSFGDITAPKFNGEATSASKAKESYGYSFNVNAAGARVTYNNGSREAWTGFAQAGNYLGFYDVTSQYYLIKNADTTFAKKGVALGASTRVEGRTLSIYESGGTPELVFDRGSSAHWKIKNESAVLKFDCDWDPINNAKYSGGTFQNRLQLGCGGDLTITGAISATKLITTNYGTSAPSGSATAGTLYFQII